MKHYWHILCIGASMGGLYAPSLQADIFKSIKKGFEKAGEKVKTAATEVGKVAKKATTETEEWFEDRAKDLKKTFERLPDCMEVVPLGIELKSKQATEAVLKSVLQAAKKLQTLDPRRTALQVQKAGLLTAKASLEASKQTALTSLKASEELTMGIGNLGKVLGDILAANFFDIRRVEFSANLGSLKAAELPMVGVTAMVAKQKLDFDLRLDLSNIPAAAEMLINEAVKQLDKR